MVDATAGIGVIIIIFANDEFSPKLLLDFFDIDKELSSMQMQCNAMQGNAGAKLSQRYRVTPSGSVWVVCVGKSLGEVE